MGREIRRVPPGWNHPRNDDGRYRPLYDRTYDEAAAKYQRDLALWRAGDESYLPYQKDGDRSDFAFVECEGAAPSPDYYRPAWPEGEATHYQVYETVSEGTPTSPVFEDLGALIQWLIGQGYSEPAARRFAEDGWAPSMVFCNGRLANDIHSLDM